jgi:hypothetical protein
VLKVEVEIATITGPAEGSEQRCTRLSDEAPADNNRDRVAGAGESAGAGEAEGVVGDAVRLRIDQLSHNRVVIDESQD